MIANDTVTVIAPAYNHEKYIIDALKSVAYQTYYNKELIVIDDCSSDETANMIELYIDRECVRELFPNGIRYIRHTKNMNAHQTINEGISQAIGRYIAIINTDDMYEENRLEIMIKKMKQSNADFAFSRVRCIDEHGNYIVHREFEDIQKNLKKLPSPSFELVIENASIGTGNFVFKKELYEKIGGFCANYHFIHDWDFILRATEFSEPLYVEDTTYLYRFHSNNTIKQIDTSSEMHQKKDWEVRDVLKKHLKSIKMGAVENPLLKNIAVWDYFFQLYPQKYCSYLWNELKSNV